VGQGGFASYDKRIFLIMGSWDATSLGNDTANDWVYELEECDDLSLIKTTIQKVLDAGDDYIEAPEAEEAVAAAEVLAWLQGHPGPVNSYTEKVALWVSENPLNVPSSLVEKALFVLDRILDDSSELNEQWDGDAKWVASMADLRTRLSGEE